MFTSLLILMAAAAVAIAQETPSDAGRTGSVSGVIRDAGDGAPIADATVSTYINARWANRAVYMTGATKRVEATSDVKGAYRLSGLAPGSYRLSARMPGRGLRVISKSVTLGAGEDLTGIDFAVQATGMISGRVLDQNKEPVVGAMVFLVSKEYALGSVGHFAKTLARTDDRGEYRLDGVGAGIPFLLMARKSNDIGVQSEAPADPKLRRPAYVATYYPGSPEPQGGTPVQIRSREHREGIDIMLARSPAFCVSGVIETAEGPAQARLMISGRELHPGVSSGGGVAIMPPGGAVPADGKFRVCDLGPGDYRLMAWLDKSKPAQLADGFVAISDRDVAGVRLHASTGFTVKGAIAWADKAPDPALADPVVIYMMPVSRGASFSGEASSPARVAAPGEFSMANVLPGDCRVQVRIDAPKVYVKSVTYGSENVQYRPLRVGGTMGNADLRVVLANDGGSVGVQVKNKDGKAVPYSYVAIIPAAADSEAEAAVRMVSDQADQNGAYTYGVLAPGKYLVLAMSSEPDATLERMSRIWGARSRAKEVEIPPNGTAHVTLEPVF